MTHSVYIWYTRRNPWDTSHILLCNGNSQMSESEHQTSKENHAECSPSQRCAWVWCFSRGPGGSTHMTLVVGRGDCCVPPHWSHQLFPARGWTCSLVRCHEQAAQATAAECTQVMPVVLLSLQCYTEQKVPRKTTARDKDSELELSSRAQHRLVCATGGALHLQR